MNLTRERIRQVEVKGLAKLQAYEDMTALRDYVDEGPVGKRKLPVISTRELDRELADDKARLALESAEDEEATRPSRHELGFAEAAQAPAPGPSPQSAVVRRSSRPHVASRCDRVA